ncbi:MAG: hypothetical protein IPK79_08355 [Vampirovibrionales bacterium]|nr:hypothetical protein [Vampirovibrionales bacterium]
MSDSEMKQLFHAIDLQKYDALTSTTHRKVDAARLYAEQKMAKNMVGYAEQDKDGNLYVKGVPIRAEDALYFSLEDIRYFQKTGRHLTLKQIIATKDKKNADLNEI